MPGEGAECGLLGAGFSDVRTYLCFALLFYQEQISRDAGLVLQWGKGRRGWLHVVVEGALGTDLHNINNEGAVQLLALRRAQQ